MESIHQFDVSLFRAIHIGLHQAWLDPFFAFFSYLGLGGVSGAVCLLFAASKETRRWVLPLLLADAIGGFLVADGLKSVIWRDRPSNLPWALPQEPHHIASFPSGHTTTAFSVGVLLFLMSAETRYKKYGRAGLMVAALIGLSRIYRGVHWPTDVMAGAMFGTATACCVYLVMPRFGWTFSTVDSQTED